MLSPLSQGGWIGSEIGKTMERYDPAENKWEVIGNMAVPRYYFGCCELQGTYTVQFSSCTGNFCAVVVHFSHTHSHFTHKKTQETHRGF